MGMGDKLTLETLLHAMQKKAPQTVVKEENRAAGIEVRDDGLAVYKQDGSEIIKFYAEAKTLDHKSIDTRKAELLSWESFPADEIFGGGKGFVYSLGKTIWF